MSKCYSQVILTLTDKITRDPVLVETCKLLFQYANEAGLKGVKLSDLTFLFADEQAGPLINMGHVFCKRHLTDEEWEEYQQQDI